MCAINYVCYNNEKENDQRIQTTKEMSHNQKIYRNFKATCIYNKRTVTSNESVNGGSNREVNKIYENTQRVV